jgi:hypothetical protein
LAVKYSQRREERDVERLEPMRRMRRVNSEEDPVKVAIFNKPYINIRAVAVDDK